MLELELELRSDKLGLGFISSLTRVSPKLSSEGYGLVLRMGRD